MRKSYNEQARGSFHATHMLNINLTVGIIAAVPKVLKTIGSVDLLEMRWPDMAASSLLLSRSAEVSMGAGGEGDLEPGDLCPCSCFHCSYGYLSFLAMKQRGMLASI